MKTFLLAASAIVSAVAITGAANAADIAPAPEPMYDWSGFYVGLNAGVAWNNSELDSNLRYNGSEDIYGYSPSEVNDFLGGIDQDVGGNDAVFTGGALIGYNWQMDSLVLGVEADINYADFGDERSDDIGGALNTLFDSGGRFSGNSEASFDANWFGTLRARLGFAADNFLFYGTGGLAYGHLEADASINVVDREAEETYSFDGSTESTNWGWTIGAGMEYGIENWSLGLEYLYVDLGSAEWDGDFNTSDLKIDTTEFDGDANIDYQFSVVRATAKLRF